MRTPAEVQEDHDNAMRVYRWMRESGTGEEEAVSAAVLFAMGTSDGREIRALNAEKPPR